MALGVLLSYRKVHRLSRLHTFRRYLEVPAKMLTRIIREVRETAAVCLAAA